VNSFISTNGETHGTSQHAKLILTMTFFKSAEKQTFMTLELHLKLFTTISTQQTSSRNILPNKQALPRWKINFFEQHLTPSLYFEPDQKECAGGSSVGHSAQLIHLCP
jgi:hypothetical protein